jgi:uncharacterized protein YbjT (DUF2867 family)
MPEKSLIAVVGATGQQGGGLVRAIQGDPTSPFRARAITRNPNSAAARALAALGAEVVAADLDDGASVARAFRGATGAYCVTNFWEQSSPEREIAQAAIMARAAKEAGVGHVVWSTLEDTRLKVPLGDDRMPTLMGKYKVPHFDAKGEADALFLATGIPVTRYYPSFYWESFVSSGAGPKPGPDGTDTLVLRLPMADRPLPGVAAEDIGATAYGLFRAGTEFHGKRVGVAGGQLTGAEMAAAMSRALGRIVRYEPIAPSTYRSLGFPGAEELGNMFQYYTELNEDLCRLRDVGLSRRLNPGLLDFEAWLGKFAAKLPLD